MSDDIVEELREGMDAGDPDVRAAERLMNEAADEIERLRAEVERLRMALADLVDRWSTEQGYDAAVQRARALVIDGNLRWPSKEQIKQALTERSPEG